MKVNGLSSLRLLIFTITFRLKIQRRSLRIRMRCFSRAEDSLHLRYPIFAIQPFAVPALRLLATKLALRKLWRDFIDYAPLEESLKPGKQPLSPIQHHAIAFYLTSHVH